MSKKNVDAIYPLTEKQHALAYYCLQLDADDPGFLQVRFALQGFVDHQTLEAAWFDTMARHESLRMSLQQPRQKQPVLVVHKTAQPDWKWIDAREQSAERQRETIEDYCRSDQLHRFDLACAPVMRLTGFQTSEREHEIVWSCHHLFLDGWSSLVVLQEWMHLYAARRAGVPPTLPRPASYRDYLAWSKAQRADEAQAFWQEYLRDLTVGTQLKYLAQHTFVQRRSRKVLRKEALPVPASWGRTVQQAANAMGVTPATFVSAAWSLWLSVVAGSQDVTFGNTTTGRHPDLPGGDSICGFLSNVVPKRCLINGAESIASLVKRVHREGIEAQPYEYVELGSIHKASSLNAMEPLFESLLIFENLPWKDLHVDVDRGVTLCNYSSGTTTTYPLTLIIKPGVQPGVEWALEFHCSEALLASAVDRAMGLFPELILRVCGDVCANVLTATDWLADELADMLTNHESAGRQPVADREQPRLPRTPTEVEVAKIWEELLGRSDLDVDADFLTLGGRSIAAVRMLAMIEDRLGKRLALVDLIERPTIANLAHLLVDGSRPITKWRSLVPIRPAGSKSPLFFVHAGGGHVLFLRTLNAHLAADWPIYGLQPVGLDGECSPMATFEEMASHYISEIQTIQPHGPYCLVGHCLGAKVAFEMARQLKASGEVIGLFVALDTKPPQTCRGPTRGANAKQAVAKIKQELWEGRVFSVFDILRKVLTGKLNAMRLRGEGLYKRHWLRRFGSVETKKKLFLEFVEKACIRAAVDYIAAPIDQKITLFRTRDTIPAHLDWQALTNDFETIDLPVGHYTMFTEPEAELLSQAISELALEADQVNRANSRNSLLDASNSA